MEEQQLLPEQPIYTSPLQQELEKVSSAVNRVRTELGKVIIGQEDMITLLLTGLFAGGHLLIEGVPGIAKTLTAKLLARTLSVDFSRIQFTPDLMPSDVIGTTVFNMKTSDFTFNRGPIFSNIVLIDEINRSPAKTQAALFEVMEELQITVDGKTYLLGFPFMVLATQNPIEQEGTYKLPEAQLDRFLFRVKITYPTFEQEKQILDRFKEDFTLKQSQDVKAVFSADEIKMCRQLVEKIHIKEELIDYIARIVFNTRNNGDLFLGASPRASLSIMKASKALAAISGRDFVTPDDIRFVTAPVLNHRIILNPEREMEGVEVEQVINDVIQKNRSAQVIRFFRGLYLSNRFFLLFGALAVVFAFSFGFSFLFYVALGLLVLCVTLIIADLFLLFNDEVRFRASRRVQPILSLGDAQTVYLEVENLSNQTLRMQVIDELPMQLQEREFSVYFTIKEAEKKMLTYSIRPIVRGEYIFGRINLYAHSVIGLVKRRFAIEAEKKAAVYPSIIQMKKFELKAFARISTLSGVKRMRRLGHSYEFEQIKNYVKGDDYRSINWKATGRKSDLMVNQYEDERAQQIYCLLDKSRSMHMPFQGLSLLDHSINTGLVISNIALHKHDKAGLMTFSDRIDSFLKAERGTQQIRKILEQLYREKERTLEANYELLYNGVRNLISGRSLLFLFTNFESYYAMERTLPILRRLNARHLLVVIFFENTEINDYASVTTKTVEEIYYQTIAQKFSSEKTQMVYQLRQYGIQSILTRPEELSMNTVNKYLELKARGLI